MARGCLPGPSSEMRPVLVPANLDAALLRCILTAEGIPPSLWSADVMGNTVFEHPQSFALLFERARRSPNAENAFYKIAFYRLRAIASALLKKERAGHTLQPTALVSELFLKLRGLEMQILGEEHFFRVAAGAMQQVLIDSARAKAALKRIPPQLVSELLPDLDGTYADPELRLTLKISLERLRCIDRTAAETVWLRSVEGQTIEEVSRSQRRETWRVRADYDFGILWLADQLTRHVGSKSAAISSAHNPTSLGRRCGSAA
jgi:RNA polymerase sigma factor (TIGR02999 family)